jgi:hypothetical protein
VCSCSHGAASPCLKGNNVASASTQRGGYNIVRRL